MEHAFLYCICEQHYPVTADQCYLRPDGSVNEATKWTAAPSVHGTIEQKRRTMGDPALLAYRAQNRRHSL
ncbi:hypothetical protein BaRGS_00021838 [Batillaria attramentaria]|uniref:Uncharacterized protein n=1 Tax=Batillaria attramentaria TaxID=370345 RepID=A0ABD0KIK0_9CAEN